MIKKKKLVNLRNPKLLKNQKKKQLHLKMKKLNHQVIQTKKLKISKMVKILESRCQRSTGYSRT